MTGNRFLQTQRRQRQEDLFDVEANMEDTVRYRTARATRRNRVKKRRNLVLWHTPLISPFQRQRDEQANFDFEESQFYRARSRKTRVTQINPVSI